MVLAMSFQSVLIGQIVCPLKCKPSRSLLRGHNPIKVCIKERGSRKKKKCSWILNWVYKKSCQRPKRACPEFTKISSLFYYYMLINVLKYTWPGHRTTFTTDPSLAGVGSVITMSPIISLAVSHILNMSNFVPTYSSSPSSTDDWFRLLKVTEIVL